MLWFLVYFLSYDLTVYDKSVLAALMRVLQHDIKGIAEEIFLRLWWMYTFCCINIFLEKYAWDMQ